MTIALAFHNLSNIEYKHHRRSLRKLGDGVCPIYFFVYSLGTMTIITR
jgi:hypothetical protein